MEANAGGRGGIGKGYVYWTGREDSQRRPGSWQLWGVNLLKALLELKFGGFQLATKAPPSISGSSSHPVGGPMLKLSMIFSNDGRWWLLSKSKSNVIKSNLEHLGTLMTFVLRVFTRGAPTEPRLRSYETQISLLTIPLYEYRVAIVVTKWGMESDSVV